MKVRIFNGTKESYTDYDYGFWKAMYGFEFAGPEEYNTYVAIKNVFMNNRKDGKTDEETIKILNDTYEKTAWSYYVADKERFDYLVNKAMGVTKNEI